MSTYANRIENFAITYLKNKIILGEITKSFKAVVSFIDLLLLLNAQDNNGQEFTTLNTFKMPFYPVNQQ